MRGKKECGVELEGQNGKFGFVVEVYRLTAELVVVEVKRKSGDVSGFRDVWKNKLRPQVLCAARVGSSASTEEVQQQEESSESQQVAGD